MDFLWVKKLVLSLKLFQNWFVLWDCWRFWLWPVSKFFFFYMGLVWNLKCVGSPFSTTLNLILLFYLQLQCPSNNKMKIWNSWFFFSWTFKNVKNRDSNPGTIQMVCKVFVRGRCIALEFLGIHGKVGHYIRKMIRI